MSQLTIQLTPKPGGATVVTVSGVADLAGAGELERAIKGVPPDHMRHVVFDLGGVTFISSIGIGVLLKIRSWITNDGGRVSLAHVGRMTKETFTHAGLQKLLPMYDRVDDALNAAPPTDPTP